MTTDNVNAWQNLDPTDPDAAGRAHTRLMRLFRNDPFVPLLSDHVRTGLASMIFSRFGVGENTLTATDYDSVHESVLRVFEMSPLSLLGEPFKQHVTDLVFLAIRPQDTATIRSLVNLDA